MFSTSASSRGEVLGAPRAARAPARFPRARRARGSALSGAHESPPPSAAARSAPRRTRGSSRASQPGRRALRCRRRTSRLLATSRSSVSRPAPVTRLGRRRRWRRRRTPRSARSAALLGVVEQVVAPVDRRAQRPLARGRVARARAERAERRRAGAAAISRGESSPQRAAASSIASGSPSTRRQISRDRAGVARRSARSPGSWARARSQNSASTASPSAAGVAGPAARAAAPGSRCSACTASGSRLVASTVSAGTGAEQPADERRGVAAGARSCRRPAAAAWRPGSARRACAADSPASDDRAERPHDRRGTSSGRRRAASDTKQRRPRSPRSTARAASSASRVLPTPPGPVSVSSRASPARSRSATAASSARGRSSGSAARQAACRAPARCARGRRGRARDRGPGSPAGASRSSAPGSIPSCSTSTSRASPVGLQRLRLAAAAIQRQHQLPVQALAPRMLARQPPQLGDQLGVAPGGQVGLDAHLERGQPQLLQPRDLGRRERRPSRAPPAAARATARSASRSAARPRAGSPAAERARPAPTSSLEALGVELARRARAGGSRPPWCSARRDRRAPGADATRTPAPS